MSAFNHDKTPGATSVPKGQSAPNAPYRGPQEPPETPCADRVHPPLTKGPGYNGPTRALDGDRVHPPMGPRK